MGHDEHQEHEEHEEHGTLESGRASTMSPSSDSSGDPSGDEADADGLTPHARIEYSADTAADHEAGNGVPNLEDLVPAGPTDTGVLIASTPATKNPIPAVLPERFEQEPQTPGTTQNRAITDTSEAPSADVHDEYSTTDQRQVSAGIQSADAVEDAAAVNADSFTDASSHPTPDGPERWSVAGVEELDELTIVSRAQDGDLDAFDWLISAYQGGVFRLCLRMLNDRSEAEDIVQETFITAWRSLPKLTVPQAFIPWLYRTATNKCLNELRRRQRRPADATADLGSDQDEAQAGPSGGRNTIGVAAPVDPAQDYETQSQMRALAQVLQTLPPGPRACWLLREVHEFSYAEIAAIVQVPESTVRGRIARAKRLLAEGMEPWR
ncbi:RNA polymerase sigma factor [Arthrobacter sp. TmT3-37]